MKLNMYRKIVRGIEVGTAGFSVLYGASAVDALIDNNYSDAKVQAIETGRYVSFFLLSVGVEHIIKDRNIKQLEKNGEENITKDGK